MQQLGGPGGSHYVMASIAGRPYTAGFRFRIMAAWYGNYVDVFNVIEYNYNKETFALESEQQLLTTVPRELPKGNFIEFTAGRNKDQFTVVYIHCRSVCEVFIRSAFILCAAFYFIS